MTQTREYQTTNKSYLASDKQIALQDTTTVSERIYDMIQLYCNNNDHLFNRETKTILFTEHDLFDDKPVVCTLYINVYIRSGRVFVKASNHRKRLTIDLGFMCNFERYMAQKFNKNTGLELYSNQ
jgi:uncharacterized membrane protein YoaT (DUF817 family)